MSRQTSDKKELTNLIKDANLLNFIGSRYVSVIYLVAMNEVNDQHKRL